MIADIACDIDGAIPSTLKTTTIEDPVYGYNPRKEALTEPFKLDCIDIMAVDNLPNELPKDASLDFGNSLVKNVMPMLITDKENEIIKKATICRDGRLMSEYDYLNNFVNS